MTDPARVQHPNTVDDALETLASAPDLFATMTAYLANPDTPRPVRQLIRHIIATADALAAGRLVVA